MKLLKISTLLLAHTLVYSAALYAKDSLQVGRKAATKYFTKDERSISSESESESRPPRKTSNVNYLFNLHFASYLKSDAYRWGPNNTESSIAKMNYGITYLFTDFMDAADAGLRLDFTEYRVNEMFTKKLSIMPVYMFPKHEHLFPFYFGFAVGPGIFFNQIENESNISADYQLFAGLQFLEIYGTAGISLELGLKNHLQLTSDGQVNGSYVALGAAFTF